MRGRLGQDLRQHPLLRRGHAAVRRRKPPLAAAFLGDGEGDVVGPRGGLGVEREPPQPGHAHAQRPRHVGGRRQDGQAGGPELFDGRPPVEQPPAHPAAEEDDVGRLPPRDRRRVLGLLPGGLRLLLQLELLPRGLVPLDRLLGDRLRRARSGRTASICSPIRWISPSSSGVISPWPTIARSIRRVRGSEAGGMRSRRPNHAPPRVTPRACRRISSGGSGANCAASSRSVRSFGAGAAAGAGR